MCFSATASFIAGSALIGAGAVSIHLAQSADRKAFAAIPLIFGLQQISEGVLWLALTHVEFAHWQSWPAFVFLFFAQAVWPVWVPWSIRAMEMNEHRRRILRPFVWLGVAVSLYLFACLLFFEVSAFADQGHIRYIIHNPTHLAKYSGLFYVLPTIFPPFISSVKRMWLLGSLVLVSYLTAQFFFGDFVISVWCYFAAVLSLMIIYILYKSRRVGVSVAPLKE